VDYAMKLYVQALRDLRAHYPDFNQHQFINGDRLGERRIVFPANLDQAAICWLRCRIWQLHEHSDLVVSESFAWREARQQIVGRLTIEFDLALDREVTDKTTWEEVSAVIKEGRPFPVSTQARKHDCGLVNEMLADVSLPELVLLNWNEARRPLSAADESLLKSVEEFDIPGIQHALHEGADPNCIDTHDDTPLVNLIDRWGHMGDIEYMKAQGQDISRYPSVEKLIEVINLLVHHGADVRMSAPDACNALSSACLVADARVVQCLLNHGGDPNIECYMDEYPSSWGSAWDSADYRCNPVIDNHDKTAWDTLVARFPEPFSQVSISENPASQPGSEKNSPTP
jgi:hypothetical protein